MTDREKMIRFVYQLRELAEAIPIMSSEAGVEAQRFANEAVKKSVEDIRKFIANKLPDIPLCPGPPPGKTDEIGTKSAQATSEPPPSATHDSK